MFGFILENSHWPPSPPITCLALMLVLPLKLMYKEPLSCVPPNNSPVPEAATE